MATVLGRTTEAELELSEARHRAELELSDARVPPGRARRGDDGCRPGAQHRPELELSAAPHRAKLELSARPGPQYPGGVEDGAPVGPVGAPVKVPQKSRANAAHASRCPLPRHRALRLLHPPQPRDPCLPVCTLADHRSRFVHG
jgi:hypothetical protein